MIQWSWDYPNKSNLFIFLGSTNVTATAVGHAFETTCKQIRWRARSLCKLKRIQKGALTRWKYNSQVRKGANQDVALIGYLVSHWWLRCRWCWCWGRRCPKGYAGAVTGEKECCEPLARIDWATGIRNWNKRCATRLDHHLFSMILHVRKTAQNLEHVAVWKHEVVVYLLRFFGKKWFRSAVYQYGGTILSSDLLTRTRARAMWW